MTAFGSRVYMFIRENGLLEKGDTVIVGFSGGADSMCLLTVLCELKKVIGLKEIRAVHVHHGLRGEEADRDEAFCREQAGRLGVTYRAVFADVSGYARAEGLSEEEAGRIIRYSEFAKEKDACAKKAVAREAETAGEALEKALRHVKTAVAHHADDQAETVLLNLARGSGLKGLGGMKAMRDGIIRPLLSVTKEDILAYLKECGAEYVTDSTNLENDHTRNRLRNIIIPALKASVNERVSEHAAETASMIAEANEFIEGLAAEYGREHFIKEKGSLSFNRRELKEKPRIMRIYVIIEALRALEVPLKDWGLKHFRDIDKALSGPTGYHLDLPCGVCAENEYSNIILTQSEGRKNEGSH